MQHYYNSVKPLLYGTRIIIHPILSSISSTAGARAPPPTPPCPPHPRPCGWAFLRRWPSSPALAWLRRWRRMRCRSSSTCVELGLRWARPHPPPLPGCLHPPLLELAFAAVAPRRRLLSRGRRPCAVAFQPLRLAVAFAGAAWPRRNRLAAP